MTEVRRYHDYDMYGHQPGCSACWQQREESNRRMRETVREMQTLPRNATVSVTLRIGKTIVKRSFKRKAGDQLDPIILSSMMVDMSYEGLKKAKANAAAHEG